MSTPFRVSGLPFNSGDVVDTSAADIVVLVGPNNSGKSRCLLELNQRLGLLPGNPIPLNAFFVNSDVSVDKAADPAEIHKWILDNRYSWVEAHDAQRRVKSIAAGDILESSIEMSWTQSGAGLGNLTSHLVRGLWCGERLTYLGSPQRLDIGAHPDHPIQWLVRDPALMKKFGDAFRSAFGMNIIVDAWGSVVRLRVSTTETQDDYKLVTNDGNPTKELVDRLARLALLETQSDGVRSFAGILVTLLATRYPLVLLDEPEAFLHPPQARQLGRHLAELQQEGQLFVSTHSLDILLGLVEARPERVLIVRLTRAGGSTSAQVLQPGDLDKLWKDPLLRFSRALDGLFHDAVVVGEGDTDTSFYSAVHALEKRRAGHHLMFTYAGGKMRIPLITRALQALGVPVRVVVDFDVLNDAGTLRSIVEGMGAEYSALIEKDRRVVDANLRGSETRPTAGSALTAISEIVGNDTAAEITRPAVALIRQALEPETGWRAAKASGAAAVPRGDATVALDRLLAALESVGVFVVPTGEVESFVKAVPGKGPRWVVEVVAGNHLESAADARNFVSKIVASLGETVDA